MLDTTTILTLLESAIGLVDSMFLAGLTLQAIDATSGREREALQALYLDLLNRSK